MTTLRQNTPVGVDRLAHLNDPADVFKNPVQLTFMRVLIDIIRRMSSEMLSRESAAPFILLTSPDGTAYKVTVADDGTLTTVNARA